MDSSFEKEKLGTKHSLICSDHFEPSCFVVRPGKVGCRLYDNSVPTIFPSFPAYYQKEKEKTAIEKVQESSAHFFQHAIGVESNHWTSLLKLVTQKYLSLRFKTYGKKHSEMVVIIICPLCNMN